MTNFSKLEKIILGIAAVAVVIFSILLWDDSLIDFGHSNSNLKQIGVLIELENDVRQKVSQEYSWRNLKKGRPVYQGDSIFSGEKSNSEIELSDGSHIQIHENSLLILNMVDGNLDLNLNFGQVSTELSGSSKVRMNSCGQIFEVDADSSSSAFDMSKNGGCKQKVELKVTSGKLAVNGNKLKKSQAAILRKGKAAEIINLESLAKVVTKAPEVTQFQKITPMPVQPKPEKLSPPILLEPQNAYNHNLLYDDEGKPKSTPYFALKWSYQNPAAHFIFQVSRDPEFKKITTERYPKGLVSRSPELPPGKYYFRIREYKGKDNSESLTPWSEAINFSISENHEDLKLSAPILTKNQIDFKAHDDQSPHVEWKPVLNADHYITNVSITPQMTNPIAKIKTTAPTVKWENYKVGKFFYRVYAVAKNQKPGKPSLLGSINIKADKPEIEPTPPKLVRARSPEDPGPPQSFQVKWTPLKVADSYKIEVSDDSQFKKPNVFISRDPASVVNIEKPGEYKWRVQPLDADKKPLTDFSDPGDLKYSLDVPLVQPKLLEPAGNLTLYFQKDFSAVFWLEWASVRQATIYDVEISQQQDFKETIYQAEVKTSRLLIRKQFPPGNIFWRVRARGEGKMSNWSDARRLQIFAGQAQDNH